MGTPFNVCVVVPLVITVVPMPLFAAGSIVIVVVTPFCV